VDFHWLCNDGSTHFPTSRNLPASLVERPSTGKPGTDSPRDDERRGMAGLGHAGSKDPGRQEWSSNRNLGVPALRNTSQLRCALLLRPIRLVIHPAKVCFPLQRGHFLQRQGRVLPIPDAAVTPSLACQIGGRYGLLMA